MKRVLLALLSVAFLAADAGAGYVVITPATQWQVTGNENSQSDIDAILAKDYGISADNLLYDKDVDTANESGPFALSYDTVFSPANDPSDANITWNPTKAYITNPWYLLVKDGRHRPAWYLFDLRNLTNVIANGTNHTEQNPYSWNGQDELQLEGFWPSDGAISHVTIYGAAVPEPASVAVWGVLGLVFGVGIHGWRRRHR